MAALFLLQTWLHAEYADVLSSGRKLHAGQQMTSPNKLFILVMNHDCNLVLLKNLTKMWWSTATWNKGGTECELWMQEDSNLVIVIPLRNFGTYVYPNFPIWNSDTVGKGASEARLTNDGQLQLVDGLGDSIWTSGALQHLVCNTRVDQHFFCIRPAMVNCLD